MKIWLAVDESGDGYLHQKYPHKVIEDNFGRYWESNKDIEPDWINNTTVELFFGREMTWEDEPIEIQIFR
jgi:hypothetical protein